MRSIYKIFAVATLVGMSAIVPASVQAQTGFASFNQVAADKVFSYDSNGNISLTSQTTPGLPVSLNLGEVLVNFQYNVNNGYNNTAFGSGFYARMTMTAVSGSGISTSGTQNSQRIDSIIIKFTAVTPVVNSYGSFSNLLTVQLTPDLVNPNGVSGTLKADQGATSAGITATNGIASAVGGGFQAVGFSSDFLDFSNVSKETLSLSLDSASPSITKNGGGTNFNAFDANIIGQFGSTPSPGTFNPTPAPPGVVSGLIGIAMGGAQFGLMKFRNRRRMKKAAATEVAA